MDPPDESATLSQSAIDAMIAQSRDQAAPPNAPPPTPPAPPPVEEQEEPPAGARTAPITSVPAEAAPPAPRAVSLSGFASRLQNLEDAVSRIGQLEGVGPQLEAQLAALADELQALNARVNEILQHLPNTLGYRVRETFTCESCGAQGSVAVPIMCLNCRKQTWLGWGPPT